MALAQIKARVNVQIVRASASDVAIAEVPSYLDLVELGGALERYWDEVTRGALDLAFNVYPRLVALPQDAATLRGMHRWAIGDAIINAAPGEDLGWADVFIGLVNTPCGGGAEGNRVIGGSYQELGQRSWAWCSKCQSLAFWDQTRPPGRCAAGNTHNHLSSGHYVARFELVPKVRVPGSP